MVVENKVTPSSRRVWGIVVAGLVGLAAGALAGYFGYSFGVVGRSPLVHLRGSSNESPFDETYRGMARLGGLEASARKCDGTPVPPGIIEREMEVIDQIEASSKKANLDPALDVARAIVAYRAATVANMQSDEQASGSAFSKKQHSFRRLDGRTHRPTTLQASFARWTTASRRVSFRKEKQ